MLFQKFDWNLESCMALRLLFLILQLKFSTAESKIVNWWPINMFTNYQPIL